MASGAAAGGAISAQNHNNIYHGYTGNGSDSGVHNPFPSMTGAPTSGIGGLAASLAGSVAMLPLGVLSVFQAFKRDKALRQDTQRLSNQWEATNKKLEDNETAAPCTHYLAYLRSKADNLKRALLHAKHDQKINSHTKNLGVAACFASLADIGAKVSHATMTALHASQAAMHSLMVATSITGGLSTLLLGPLVFIHAFRTGKHRDQQVTSKRTQIERQLNLAKRLLEAKAQQANTNEPSEFNTYKNFIERQGQKRTDFFRGFKQWNKAFRIATGIYGLAVSTQIGIAAAASCIGSAFAANPIGLGVVLSLTTLAGLGMSVSSFVLSRREKKYFGHTAQQGQLFNRDLLVLNQTANPTAANTRFNLAATCLKRLNARKDAVRSFLNNTATQKQKISPLGLSESGRNSNKTQATIWTKLQGKNLNSKTLSNILESEDGKTQVKAFLKADIEAEIELLNKQIEAHNSLGQNEQLENVGDTLGDQKEQAETLLGSLNHNNNINYGDILKHWGITKGNPKHSDSLVFSKYVLKKMDRALRDERGVLFETQLQAAAAPQFEASTRG